jgi:hypothetical protein
MEHDIPYKYRNWPRWLKILVNIEAKNLRLLRKEEKLLDLDSYSDSKVIRYF